jgi:excisionase family DNA binding protein
VTPADLLPPHRLAERGSTDPERARLAGLDASRPGLRSPAGNPRTDRARSGAPPVSAERLVERKSQRDADGTTRCSHCGKIAGNGAASDPLELANRMSLRPPEAAAVLGVSERTFRDLLPEIPHFRRGNLVLVPVDQLRAWLAERVRAQAAATEAVVAELIGAGRK